MPPGNGVGRGRERAAAGDGGWDFRSEADGAGCGLDRAGRQLIKRPVAALFTCHDRYEEMR